MMRYPLVILACVATLAGCAGPLPAVDPQQAWVDMHTFTGKLVMADKLDGKTTYDGRYFQMAPGSHTLKVRYDYEYQAGGLGLTMDLYNELTCYIDVRYDHFAAGERYKLEVRHIANDITARLFDAERREVAREGDINCI